MQDKEQRTEEATPRRKEKLRSEGKVARSQDVGAVAVLTAVTAALAFGGDQLVRGLMVFSSRMFRLHDVDRPLEAVTLSLDVITTVAIPVVSASLVGATVGVAQARLFSLELAAFKPERLNPLPQLKRMVPGKESMLELAKQLAKLVAIGAVSYKLIEAATPTFAVLAMAEIPVGAAYVGEVAAKLAMQGGMAFVCVAALDYWLAHRRFTEEAKMSRQDLKDEHKQEEGDPHVRQQRRRRMLDLVKQRAEGGVKEATVVVCNPTHVSVALRYEPTRDAAPTVVAKGLDDSALEMRREARRHGVPIVENRSLARALHGGVKIGQPIPAELYRAVAEIVARVMQLRARPARHLQPERVAPLTEADEEHS